MTPPRPPRGWEALLAAALPRRDRPAILGDLAEGFAREAVRRDVAHARRWYRREVVRALVPALLRRLEPPHTEEGRMATWIDERRRDARFALRSLRTTPVFAAVAVVTLALGVGAVTALYSVVDGTLLEPLPFRDADELVLLSTYNDAEGQDRYFVSPQDFGDWRERAGSFAAMAAYWPTPVAVTGSEGAAERLTGVWVTENFFDVVGASMLVGPGMGQENGPGSSQVAVLSHGLWVRRFGSDPSVVGRAVTLDGAPVEVVGVLRSDQAFPDRGDVWLNMTWPMTIQSRIARWMSAVGRLRPGSGADQARDEMERIAGELAVAHPADVGWGVRVDPLRERLVGDTAPVLWILLSATGLILLIACANVANLLLARSEARGRELAVRSALGAGRGRIAWQLLTESLILAGLGGAAGVALAWAGLVLLRPLLASSLPPWAALELDGTVLAVALAATLATGALFGLAPIVRVLGGGLAGGLRAGGRGGGGGRLQGSFVVVQLALALVLAVGAGLLVRSFQALQAVDTGFRADGVLTFELDLGPAVAPDDQAVLDTYRAVTERLRAVRGVEAVGAASTLPLGEGLDYAQPFGVEGRPVGPDAERRAFYRHLVPGFLEAMGVTVTSGRALEDRDREDAPGVALVNRALAERFFPGEDPVGERLVDTRYRWGPLGAVLRDTLEVVGVVEDVLYEGVRAGAQPALYVSQWQAPMRRMTFTARTDDDPAALLPEVRRAVAEVDADLPLSEVRTMSAVLGQSLAADRLGTVVLGLFGVVALLLAAVGVYGVLSYGVARRVPEMGLRMALGADGGDVRRLVMGQALRMALVGIGVGTAVALVAAGALRARLYAVAPRDPGVLIAVALVLAGVAALGAWMPARRATRVDPLVALRAEGGRR